MLGAPDLDALADWYREHARDLPWRRPDFDAWGTLVSEIMLQQTQVARVRIAIDEWLARWPTPEALADAPTHEVLRQWGTLGYPRRALRLQDAARAIAERHGGVVPRDVDELLALPGVGDYTARAVAVFHFGDRHPVVDTNVRRVVARAVHGQGEQGPAARRDLADVEALLPEARADAAVVSIALMEPRRPRVHRAHPRLRGVPARGGVRVARGGPSRLRGAPRAAAAALRGERPPGPGNGAAGAPRARRSARRGGACRPCGRTPSSLERALASLAEDGLVVREGGSVSLPD
ncbi:A/G-specific adenine glycosylase [Agrococcus sp. SL85]|nr:A/G-specific adenine glycosylase [Agrococcus sp. SL85]WAC66298.1 A/G-specific adenine glycosylase [Agrococcus sp. SL85]